MAIAQVIGTDTIWGNVILYVAPTVSVVAGIVFYQVRLQASWYAERWQIRRARKTLEGQLSNQNASEAHKSRIKEMIEELDRAVAEAELSRIKSIFPSR
ncbi:hypothetical protein L083_1194 [Actinoplanes sp. N902-109]|nr:hypothetical protein L083_1194 [Actinoplanes sp. N902-109]